jgi:exonuclease SbcD
MRVLHTSDLHLGKKLEGRERLVEQKIVLQEILDIIVKNNIELIICAGDIFDTYNPSAEAEQVFFHYAKKFAEDGRAFVVISGNHDDSKRLIATVPLSQELNIFIIGNQKQLFTGNTKSSNIKLIESGEGYLIFENKLNEKIFINTMPYPSEFRFKEENKNEDYLSQMQRWLNIGHINNNNNYPEILLTHIFTLGGTMCSSEREIDLGGAKAYPPKNLPKCDYVALGHLHKFQKVAENTYYSGSIMQYAFDEAGIDKYVITFDIHNKENERITNFEKHNLKSIKRLVKLSANSIYQAKALLDNNKNCYIELSLYLDKPISHTEHKELIADYPDIVSVITIIEEAEKKKQTRKNFNKKEMFIAYYKYKYQNEPSKELLDLYLELMEAE